MYVLCIQQLFLLSIFSPQFTTPLIGAYIGKKREVKISEAFPRQQTRMQDALRSAFGWGDDAEAQRAITSLFPGGIPAQVIDSAVGSLLQRSVDARIISPFAHAGGLSDVQQALQQHRPAPGATPDAAPALTPTTAAPSAPCFVVTTAGGGGNVSDFINPSGPPAAPRTPRALEAAIAQRMAAEAGATTEHAAKARRGRPPATGVTYTKEYFAVKRYRARQRQMVRRER